MNDAWLSLRHPIMVRTLEKIFQEWDRSNLMSPNYTDQVLVSLKLVSMLLELLHDSLRPDRGLKELHQELLSEQELR